ncbi:MAG: hypothetical protein M3463_05600 [Verrucomicrobiota bacterium]|nr:hypothetical protein [Verrucomicrobiota bacterium]
MKPKQTHHQAIRTLCFGVLLIFCALPATGIAEPKIITDEMSDEELRRYRDEQVALLKRRARETQPETTADGTVHRVFYCTVYYTPKESGFTAERGFDVTPATAPGLGGRKYPRSFLAAVKKEGFGRLAQPVRGRNYLQYAGGGRYQFASAALGSRGNVLVARQSCAISPRNPHLRQRGEIVIKSPTVEAATGSSEWLIGDTGGGVQPLQIDLYWGEDEPRGPAGRNLARPAGTAMEYAFDVTVIVKKKPTPPKTD